MVEEFKRLYEDNYKKVYFYLRSLCKDDSLAEDLVQETFYNVLTLVCSGRKLQVCGSWFIKIAHNVFLDYLRKNKSAAAALDNYEDRLQEAASDSAARLDLLDVMNRLPVRYRSIILLRDYYGFRYDEISEITGTAESAVKVVIFRARNKFREVYEKYGRE